ncbi:MAG: TylF/MycF family methyltransferase [Cytophagaceae bacterium]|nr:TylF/MycF family methyltransferase [Cytophagaceae bacterium]
MLKKWIARFVPYSWILYFQYLRAPQRFLLLKKSQLSYATDNLFTKNNADFIREPRFAEAYRLAEKLGSDLMPKDGMQWRIYVLCWAAEQVSHLPGDFVACGVYRGFCDRAIMHYVDFQQLSKTYYLMDTFGGLDERYSTEAELQQQLRYKKVQVNLYREVQENFRDFNVKLVKGAIPDTLPLADTAQICFLSVDMNTVMPEIAAMAYFWDKLVPGAMVVLDDYGYPGRQAQKDAHDAFARSKGVSILSLPTCQGLLMKPV